MRQGEYRRMFQTFRKVIRYKSIVDYVRNGVRMIKDENRMILITRCR